MGNKKPITLILIGLFLGFLIEFAVMSVIWHHATTRNGGYAGQIARHLNTATNNIVAKNGTLLDCKNIKRRLYGLANQWSIDAYHSMSDMRHSDKIMTVDNAKKIDNVIKGTGYDAPDAERARKQIIIEGASDNNKN